MMVSVLNGADGPSWVKTRTDSSLWSRPVPGFWQSPPGPGRLETLMMVDEYSEDRNSIAHNTPILLNVRLHSPIQ